MENIELQRVNVRLRKDIIEWYRGKASSYAMGYSNYVAMIATQYAEQQMQIEMSMKLNNTLQEMKDLAGGQSNAEMMQEMQQMLLQMEKMQAGK